VEVPRVRLRKPDSPSKYIQSEARKVSTELGKVMEEAFNRSSVGSSIRTSGTDRQRDYPQYDSPPTSFSNTRESNGSSVATPNTKAALAQRPLPPIPNETPNTFLQRKLAETRAEIARRLNEDGDNTDHFTEVLKNLDRLMLPVTGGKRTVSAPGKSPEHPAPLHVIPEEKFDHGDGCDQSYSPQYRAVTDPIRPQAHRAVTEQQTIRLVDRSPTRVAPLNIRKRSSASTLLRGSNDGNSVPWPGPSSVATVRPYQEVQNDLLAARTKDVVAVPERKEIMVKKKKSFWFRRSTEEDELEQENKENNVKKKVSTRILQIPEAWQSLDDRLKHEPPIVRANPDGLKHIIKQSDGSTGSEFPMRNSSASAPKGDNAAKKAFFALFSRKAKEDKGKRPMELGSKFSTPLYRRSFPNSFGAVDFSSSSIFSSFDRCPENGTDNAPRTGPLDMQMNWLSRFLHIKPASKTLCFNIGRGKVRQDLVCLLRDWQRFGVRDVHFDRNSNVIDARVDKNNRKYTPYSSLIFIEWKMQDWRIEIEMLECESVLRCNAAFLSLLRPSFR
jgi:serine/threonine-protein kinase HSL1 (negative regulator of Swe1 kinase)